ncbi:MAG: UDP-N-acetylmuramate--L-alanine ligase, partial [Actinomycetia bacterium]|nr:UDP-N-acetylmuramate--L-alanine ligase [Actinomycetes bacterium]
LPQIVKPYISYGINEDAELRAANICEGFGEISYDCYFKGELLGKVEMKLFGIHNIVNSLSAVGIGLELGIPFNTICEGLFDFKGVERRMERVFKNKNINIFDDYAHHPTEVKATIRALKKGKPEKSRLIIVFQPHRFTRTRDLYEDFGTSFHGADKIYLTDIYPAGEPEIPGITAGLIYDALKANEFDKITSYIKDIDELENAIYSDLKESDIIVTMGAGNIYKVGRRIRDRLYNG